VAGGHVDVRPQDEGPAGLDKPEGPVSAAVIAVGFGACALGTLTILVEASTTVADWLQFSDSVGPLSGKAIMSVLGWSVAWAILHVGLRGKRHGMGPALTIALVLLGFGVLGTFPTFFHLFSGD